MNPKRRSILAIFAAMIGVEKGLAAQTANPHAKEGFVFSTEPAINENFYVTINSKKLVISGDGRDVTLSIKEIMDILEGKS